jgi:iron complex transport system substrate-binding protein
MMAPFLRPWAAAGLLALTAAAPAPPRRIVSVNLCSDQLLLALADRSQIAGLSAYVLSADMSAEAARARGLPVLRDSAEQLLEADPDLVIGMPIGGSAALAGRAYPTLDLKPADSLDAIYAAIRQTARATGHAARGEAIVAAMRRDLARLGRPGRGRVAAYYQRRGYLTGSGTLIDDLMRRLGLVNLATRLGKGPLSRLSVEEMVAARPNYLIVESATDDVRDQGTEMLHHPALRSIPRISLPEAWTVCGGPAYVRAAQAIARQLPR